MQYAIEIEKQIKDATRAFFRHTKLCPECKQAGAQSNGRPVCAISKVLHTAWTSLYNLRPAAAPLARSA